MPKVSVIVTLYNYEKYIKECLESVQNQTFQDWECIVVDDCSTDEGPAIVQEFVRKDKRFAAVHALENCGYGACKNKGILASSGEFIRPLDADDKLLPNALEDALKAFEKHPEVSLVHGYATRWYGGNDTRGVNKKTYCHAQGRMWRRDVYQDFGLYYEPLRSMGDKEFIYRLGVHPDSPLKRRVKDYKLKKIVAYYRKHDQLVQMHKYRKYVNPEVGKQIKKQFKARIKQLKREGITRENTEFL